MYKNLIRRAAAARIFPTVIFMAGMLGASYHILLFGAAITAALLGILFLPPKLNYSFEEGEQEKWDQLRSAWTAVFASKKLFQVVPRALGGYCAGSAPEENAVEYFPAAPKNIFPLPIRLNVEAPVLKLKEGYLAVLPDTLFFVRELNGVALGYEDVQIHVDAIGYLENGQVAEDTEVIGHRWIFANSDGTPDDRYPDNAELPMVRFGRVLIQSEEGLSVQLICSNEKAAAALGALLER